MALKNQIMDKIEKEITLAYKTPGHPIAFSSPGTIFNFYKKTVPLKTIKNVLAKIDAYTLHREYKKPQKHNPYYVYTRRTHFQADLIDISALKRNNRGISFLLVVLDVFSRRMWVMPLKQKTAVDTANALMKWIESLESDFRGGEFHSDSGKEFVNRLVKSKLQSKGMTMTQAKNIHKASIVERANKSLQVLIYKYLTAQGETNYIDVLPKLVSTYNKRGHRTLKGFSPNEADCAKNQAIIRGIHMARYGQIKRQKVAKFRVGDTVRIKTYGKTVSSARRAYLQQFHGELFTVQKISKRMPIPMYFLSSMNTNEAVEGGFYANEMTQILGDTFKIERIIKRKGSGANQKLYVKWKYFGPQWNSWIDAKDVQRT